MATYTSIVFEVYPGMSVSLLILSHMFSANIYEMISGVCQHGSLCRARECVL